MRSGKNPFSYLPPETMTSITVFREFKDAGALRKYKVMLDGDNVGKIKIGQTLEIPVEPGVHELYVKVDWSRSKKTMFTVVDGEKQQFRCRNRVNWYNIFHIVYYGYFKFNDSLLLEKINNLKET